MNLLNINKLSIKKLSNRYLNFKSYLTSRDSIEWNKCDSLNIIIKSKINKLEFNNCSDISIFLYGTITGLEINNSTNITLIIPNNNCISCIQTYKSYINVICCSNIFNKIILLNENSSIHLIKKN